MKEKKKKKEKGRKDGAEKIKKKLKKKEGVNEEQRFVKQMKFDNMDEVST